jgi:hypothetical protein
MKSNTTANSNLATLLLATAIILLVVDIAYHFLSDNQPKIVRFVIAPVAADTGQKGRIDSNAIKSLDETLKRYETNSPNEFLTNALETQRNFFIGIITVLSLLVALVGIYALIQRYFDRDLEKQLRALIAESRIEIEELKSSRAELGIISFCGLVFQKSVGRARLSDGTDVHDSNSYAQYMIEEMKKNLPHLSLQNIFDYSAIVTSYCQAFLRLGADKGWGTLEYKLGTNKVLSTFFNYLYSILDKENYEKVRAEYIGAIRKIHNKDVEF